MSQPNFAEYKLNDSKDSVECISKLTKESSIEDIFKAIDTYYPRWIEYRAKSMVDEMEVFQRQWNNMCKAFKIKEQQGILLVVSTFIDERMHLKEQGITKTTHSCIYHLCDLLTAKGYWVRDDGAMNQCTQCKKICFAPQYYAQYRMPSNGKCLKCNRHSTVGMKKIMMDQIRRAKTAQQKQMSGQNQRDSGAEPGQSSPGQSSPGPESS